MFPHAIASFALLAVFSGASASSKEEQAATVHVVEPGDSLWKIAQETGCSLKALEDANALADADVLRVGREIRIPRCVAGRNGQTSRVHEVGPGDTLSRIVLRYGTTVEALKELNDLKDSVIVVGRELRVPGRELRAQVVAGQSVGRPFRGTLENGARLRAGRGYHLRRPDRTYAARHVIDYTAAALAIVRDAHPRLHAIAVGDLSGKGGGWISGHRSHQSGRDVDVGLCFKRRPRSYPKEFAVGTVDNLDVAATWDLVKAFADTEGKPGGAEIIFLDYDLQGVLYEHARARGVSRATLDRVLQYPHGRWARRGLVRHLRAHDDHLHVRFACPDGDEGCR